MNPSKYIYKYLYLAVAFYTLASSRPFLEPGGHKQWVVLLAVVVVMLTSLASTLFLSMLKPTVSKSLLSSLKSSHGGSLRLA